MLDPRRKSANAKRVHTSRTAAGSQGALKQGRQAGRTVRTFFLVSCAGCSQCSPGFIRVSSGMSRTATRPSIHPSIHPPPSATRRHATFLGWFDLAQFEREEIDRICLPIILGFMVCSGLPFSEAAYQSPAIPANADEWRLQAEGGSA